MSTADEIRLQIAATQRAIQETRQANEQAVRDKAAAVERQLLRRELDQLQLDKRNEEFMLQHHRDQRDWIDQDLGGASLPDDDIARRPSMVTSDDAIAPRDKVEEEFKTSSVVAKAEFVWKIGQMSWLVEGLKHRDQDCLTSRALEVGGSEFLFQYSPAGGDEGTLAIWHAESTNGVIFRYRVFIRRKGGDFVQWGETGNVCMPNQDVDDTSFGPDVPDGSVALSQGIFGLSHKALLRSEWLEDDTLTVRFELEVRLPIVLDKIQEPLPVNVEIPSATMAADFLSLLDTERCSDVTILVDGETIKAHSQILCSRSEVFDRLLNGGMRESASKEIQIEDCSALTFKALLRFLYTDDFGCMNEAMQNQRCGDQSSSRCGDQAGSSVSSGHQVTWLQSVLAVSHKYALVRLQAWCEQKLCECIAVKEVCSILCQAHLYEAKQLANACLNYIRERHAAMIVTEEFGTLAKEWPEVMLKINLCIAGVAEASATPAILASQRRSSKRKRAE